MDCQTISRIVFLLFIVVTSVYFMFVNKRDNIERFQDEGAPSSPAPAAAPSKTTTAPPKKGVKIQKYNPEMYLDSKDVEFVTTVIKDLYKANFDKDPSKKQIDFYLAYIETRQLSIDDLNEIIAGNTKVRDQSFYRSGTRSFEYDQTGPVLGTEDEVISVFNEVLDRNPDSAELKYYATKMKDDEAFNSDALKQLLLASQEYKRLENLQSNDAHGGVLGNVTDRQMNFTVSKIYREVTRSELDDDTLKFLKKKFVQFELKEDTLRKFLEEFFKFQKKFEEDIENAAPTGVSSVALKNSKNATKPNKGSSADDGKSAGEGFSENEIGMNSESKPNQALLNKLQRIYASETDEDGKYLSSSKVINTLLNDDEKCDNLDKDALEKRLETMDKQLLAKLVYDRNMDHMKNVCRRNKKYINADENMVLFPEFKWSVPQPFPPVCTPLEKNEYQPSVDQTALIGTLIKDASKTKVGSILPETPPHT